MNKNSIDKIETKTNVFDIQFAPTTNTTSELIGASTIDGNILFYEKNKIDGKIAQKLILQNHKKSCRTFKIFQNAHNLVSGSLDKRCVFSDLNSEVKIIWKSQKHPEAVNALFILNEDVFVSGDDGGNIFLWDLRTSSKAICFQNNYDDCVFEIIMSSDLKNLFATCGDRLQVYDIRKNYNLKSKIMSAGQNEDLYSLALINDEKDVVCASSEGALKIFSRDNILHFNDSIDIQRSVSIQSIVNLDEKSLMVGGSDGLLRLVELCFKFRSNILFQHSDDGTSVEKLCLNDAKTLLGSSSHDGIISLFNVAEIKESEKSRKKQKSRSKTAYSNSKNDSFFDSI